MSFLGCSGCPMRVAWIRLRNCALGRPSRAIMLLAAAWGWITFAPCAQATTSETDWRSDWAVLDGFAIKVDTRGYRFPTAIAFVPEPGPGPKNPLYFVAELRGTIKVVTNDRTVLTFAQDFFSLPIEQEPGPASANNGLTGLCLDPIHGYVFATIYYHGADGHYHNGIVRFTTKPKSFSVTPESSVPLAEILAHPDASFTQTIGGHQIGSCETTDGLLYVGLGDGKQPFKAQDLDSPLGKILRMTVDGHAGRGNPFYDAEDGISARDYIWAYGFRNPFGLTVTDGHVFITDNGPGVDRFLEAKRGWNYLYDGTDTSVATNSIAMLTPGRGVADVDYYSGAMEVLPEDYAGNFFVVVSGRPRGNVA
jgi:hypothetical protein